jgi:hypothetical protein
LTLIAGCGGTVCAFICRWGELLVSPQQDAFQILIEKAR